MKRKGFSILFALVLMLGFSLVAAPSVAYADSPPFNNPDYFYKRLLDTGPDGPRWPDYNAIAGKISWYQSGYTGYFADYDANTLELSNVTPLAPDKDVYITTFSKDGQYIYFQDVDPAHMTSLVVTGGTIDAYPAYRYDIAANTVELIFDISTIPAATIEALTSYVGDEFGFYLGPTDSNDEVLMCVRDGNGQMDIVSYDITGKTFVNLTSSAQAEYDGRYFGTDTSQLLYWTESYPGHANRSVAILSSGGETVIDTKTSPDMYLSCRWGADQNHVMAMQGTGWSNTDLVMFTKSGGVWSTPPEDLTGDGWSATDGGLQVGAWVGNGFIFGVRSSPGDSDNGLWVAMLPADEVWVDDDYYDGGPNDGHTWGYDAFDSIQDGIDAVAGSTVHVAAGIYAETVVIDKQLTLQGAGSASTIIDATGGSTGIMLTAGGVSASQRLTIKGLTVRNSTLDGIRAYKKAGELNLYLYYVTLEDVILTLNAAKGMEIHNDTIVSDMEIKDCEFVNNVAQGLRTASNVIVEGMTITDSKFNGNSYGIYLQGTINDVTILRSEFNSNVGHGGYMTETGPLSNLMIEDSQFNGNYYGLVVWNVCDNTDIAIRRTSFQDNGKGGIWMVGDSLTNVLVEKCEVVNNDVLNSGVYGMTFGADTDVMTNVAVHFTNIDGQTGGIENYSLVDTAIIDATLNWWGDVSGPYHLTSWSYYGMEITNPDGQGDAVTDYVLYEPWKGQEGMATGGGWFIAENNGNFVGTTPGGRATFGFVAKQKDSKSSGQLEFQYHADELNLKSTSYDWVSVASVQVMFEGEGILNGVSGYRFRVWAFDGDKAGGQPDRFTIRIWTGSDSYESPTYRAEGDLGGGQIVVHKK